jgi:hypothetical protein
MLQLRIVMWDDLICYRDTGVNFESVHRDILTG